MTSPTADRRLGLVGNTSVKAPVDCATTANITLSGEQTIDGILTAASRVLVKNQTNPVQNGIYDTSTAAWTRSMDADGNFDLTTGSLVYVAGGALVGGAFYSCVTPKPIIVGTTALVFSQTATMFINALGGGVTDDSVAVLAALNSGLMVDGRGKTYGVTGSIQPSNFKGFFNGRLKQLAPATSSVRTLFLHSLSDFILRDVVIDEGGLYTAGSLNDCAGIWIDGTTPSGFLLDNVLVTNGGPGTGISIHGASNFALNNCRATEFYHNVGATNDVTQGIWFDNCTDFKVVGGGVKNLTGISTARYSRGMVFGGCSYFSVLGVVCDTVDQCFDVTGSLGNHDFVFSGCVARNGGTFGFKAANSAQNGRYVGCVASDCGLMSYVISGPTDNTNPLPQNIEFVGCESRNVGSSGLWVSAQAFRVESVNTIDASYPRGVRFIDCIAFDDQVSPTMYAAFVCDVLPIAYPTAGYDKNVANTAVNCKAAWTGSPGISFSGIHIPMVAATGTGTDTVLTSTWKRISFDAGIEDTSGIHNASSNADIFYIKEPGWYQARAQVAFQSNATGLREVRFSLNGGALPAIAYQGAHPTLATYVTNQAIIYVDKPGYTITVEAFQTSGISLTVDRTQTFVAINKVY